MVRVSSSGWVLVAGMAAVVPSQVATGATGDGEAVEVVTASATVSRVLGDTTDVTLRFVQEDGPESGHVRVLLTPETRALTIIEARSAAQQAFLEALKEPGIGDNLSRITVVVRLMPSSHPNPDETNQVIVFQHRGGHDWSVLSGE